MPLYVTPLQIEEALDAISRKADEKGAERLSLVEVLQTAIPKLNIISPAPLAEDQPYAEYLLGILHSMGVLILEDEEAELPDLLPSSVIFDPLDRVPLEYIYKSTGSIESSLAQAIGRIQRGNQYTLPLESDLELARLVMKSHDPDIIFEETTQEIISLFAKLFAGHENRPVEPRDAVLGSVVMRILYPGIV